MKHCVMSCHAEPTRRFFKTVYPLTICQSRTLEISHEYARDIFKKIKNGYYDINDAIDILGDSFEVTDYDSDDAVLDYYLWAFEDEYNDENGGFNLENFDHKLNISGRGMRFSELVKNNPDIRNIIWLAYAPNW